VKHVGWVHATGVQKKLWFQVLSCLYLTLWALLPLATEDLGPCGCLGSRVCSIFNNIWIMNFLKELREMPPPPKVKLGLCPQCLSPSQRQERWGGTQGKHVTSCCAGPPNSLGLRLEMGYSILPYWDQGQEGLVLPSLWFPKLIYSSVMKRIREIWNILPK
jgi:hypothetical protein